MKKREYPKTIFRKKLIKGVFWTVFALVFFLSIVSIIRVGNAGANQTEEKPVQQVENKVNLAAGEGAQSFSQNFASEYFDWQNTDEGKKNRVDRLSPYLANGLDEQAGLDFNGMEWDSSLSDSQVWNVEETGEDTALITLRVNHTLRKETPPDPKAVEKAKKDKKPAPKPKEEKSGPHEKYFVIPVKTDGKSFVVYKVPYFIPAPNKPDIVANEPVKEDGKIMDSQVEGEITNALNTFFKVYTSGTQEELAYYIPQGSDISTMKGIISFKEIKDIVIKQGKGKTEYQVYANVMFQENQSKGHVVYPYKITLQKEDNRFFIKELKNQ
jgi:hypothetical protein